MSKKKYNKGNKKSFSGKNLKLDPNDLKGLSQKQMVKYALGNLRKVVAPLYSATYDNDYHIPFINYSDPYSFANKQIDKITKFLLLNYAFYVRACEVANVDEYFERVENLNNVDCCGVLSDVEFDPEEVSVENVLAQILAESFFEELNELFKISMDDIFYTLDKALDMAFDDEE